MITPPIFKSSTQLGNANAKHYPTHITMWKDCHEYDAVLAQEIYEWRFMAIRSLPFLALGLVAAWLVSWYLLPLVLITLYIPRKVSSWCREMEFRGHTVEAVVSVEKYGRELEEKLLSEARSLTQYEEFRGWEVDALLAELKKRLPLAREWVANQK